MNQGPVEEAGPSHYQQPTPDHQHQPHQPQQQQPPHADSTPDLSQLYIQSDKLEPGADLSAAYAPAGYAYAEESGGGGGLVPGFAPGFLPAYHYGIAPALDFNMLWTPWPLEMIQGNELASPLAEYQPAGFASTSVLQPRLPPLQPPPLADFPLPFMTRSAAATAHYGMRTQPAASRKGGRRPREVEEKDYDLTDEDKDKRAKRRQRNKEAAARCRKRRLDLMESLQQQVDALREENRQKQLLIDQLTQQKCKLDELLRHSCQLAAAEPMKPDELGLYAAAAAANNGGCDMLMRAALKAEVDEYEHQQHQQQQQHEQQQQQQQAACNNNGAQRRLADEMELYEAAASPAAYAISSCSMLINNDPIISEAALPPALKRARLGPPPPPPPPHHLHELDACQQQQLQQQQQQQQQQHVFARPTSLTLTSTSQYMPNDMQLPSITTPSSGLGNEYSLLNQQTFLTPLVPGAVPVPLHTPPHNAELRQL